MKIYNEGEIFKVDVLERLVNITLKDTLVSPSNTYVVFDGAAKIYFEGTIQECEAYKRVVGKDYLCIYAKESYDYMISKINKTKQ